MLSALLREESVVNFGAGGSMNTYTAIIEQDDEWFFAYCPEVPGANGQGQTVEECKQNLAQAIELVLEDLREDFSRGLPDNVIRGTVSA
jgi:predicted RNase H-like HicB family nuclease